MQGGISLSLERMNRIKEINFTDAVAIVEPGVITGELQAAVRAQKLFYPPDPASLAHCSIGGNVATNAGGPALSQVRRDPPLHRRARGGAGERRGLAHGRPGAQKQNRLRPDRAFRRLRGNARRRHGNHRAAAPASASARDLIVLVRDHGGGRGHRAGDLCGRLFAFVSSRSRIILPSKPRARSTAAALIPRGKRTLARRRRRPRGDGAQRSGGAGKTNRRPAAELAHHRHHRGWLRKALGLASRVQQFPPCDRPDQTEPGHRGAAEPARRSGRVRGPPCRLGTDSRSPTSVTRATATSTSTSWPQITKDRAVQATGRGRRSMNYSRKSSRGAESSPVSMASASRRNAGGRRRRARSRARCTSG